MIFRSCKFAAIALARLILGCASNSGVVSIPQRIALLRNHKVLLDADLEEVYGLQTKVFLQAVKRNLNRFPSDFMFQLDAKELHILRSQSVTSKLRHGGRLCAPFAFTEQGLNAEGVVFLKIPPLITKKVLQI